MNEALQIIHARRSIHGDFGDRPVAEEDLETILAASVRAPSANARQPYSIVVVAEPETMMAVCGYRASRMLVYCVDYTRLADAAKHLGCEYQLSDLFDFVTGSSDTMLAVENAVIAANSLGIDTLTTNGIHRGDIERVYRVLELPETGCFPLIALLLGYRGRSQGPQRGRVLERGIVHRERYHRLTPDELDALVAEYDDRDRHLGLIEDWRKQRFKHYLEWFFKRWNPRVDTAQFYAALARAGFIRSDRWPGCDGARDPSAAGNPSATRDPGD